MAVAAGAGAVVASGSGIAVAGSEVSGSEMSGAEVGGTAVAGTAVAGADVGGAGVGVAASPQAAATMTSTRNILRKPRAILCFLAPRKVRFDPLINSITSLSGQKAGVALMTPRYFITNC